MSKVSWMTQNARLFSHELVSLRPCVSVSCRQGGTFSDDLVQQWQVKGVVPFGHIRYKYLFVYSYNNFASRETPKVHLKRFMKFNRSHLMVGEMVDDLWNKMHNFSVSYKSVKTQRVFDLIINLNQIDVIVKNDIQKLVFLLALKMERSVLNYLDST